MNGQCLKENTIYQATVTEEVSGKVETYIGLASTTWKARLAVHKSSMTHRPKPQAKSKNGTELSTHTWKLKDKGIKYSLSWKLIDRAQTFNPSTNKCRLCLTEKYHLMFNKEGATLNQRSEFYTACRHKKKLLISNGWDEPCGLTPFHFLWPWLSRLCFIIAIPLCLSEEWGAPWAAYETSCNKLMGPKLIWIYSDI